MGKTWILSLQLMLDRLCFLPVVRWCTLESLCRNQKIASCVESNKAPRRGLAVWCCSMNLAPRRGLVVWCCSLNLAMVFRMLTGNLVLISVVSGNSKRPSLVKLFRTFLSCCGWGTSDYTKGSHGVVYLFKPWLSVKLSSDTCGHLNENH